MPSLEFTKSELVGILETIEAAQSCADEAGMRGLLLKAMDSVEAQWSICGVVGVPASGPLELRAVLNGNYPLEMFGHYLSERFYAKDPVVRYHANFSTTRLWSEIFSEVDDEAARQVVNYASDFGLKYGVSSGLYLPETESVIITSFSGPRPGFKGRHKRMADILAVHINKAVARCLSGFPSAVKKQGQPLASF